MANQFVDYVSNESPGTKLVSSIQYKNFPNETYHGVVFYITLVGLSPSLITFMPNIKLRVTLLESDINQAPTYLLLTSKLREFPFKSSYITLDGKRTEVNAPLDKALKEQVKSIEGMLYFEIPKSKEQIIATMYIDVL